MITGYRWRGDRVLLVALILSILLHFSGAAIYGLVTRALTRLHIAAPHPQPTEQLVTISSALRFERRPRPVVSHALVPRHTAVHVAQKPVSPSLPKVEIAVPRYRPPVAFKPELSRMVPHSQSQGTPVPKPARVAFEQQREPEQRAQTSGASTLTPQQLAQLNADFSRTISQARSLDNPLRAPDRPPASQKRYRLQFMGANGALGECEGRWWPIKMWQNGSLDYYYASYECVWPDGTYEDGGVPWPIIYPASRDPLAYEMDPNIPVNEYPRANEDIPLPGPPDGWKLPPGMRIGKVMRQILGAGPPAN